VTAQIVPTRGTSATGALLCAYVERLVGMDAMERWFVLLAVAGLLGFGATVAWVLAQA